MNKMNNGRERDKAKDRNTKTLIEDRMPFINTKPYIINQKESIVIENQTESQAHKQTRT